MKDEMGLSISSVGWWHVPEPPAMGVVRFRWILQALRASVPQAMHRLRDLRADNLAHGHSCLFPGSAGRRPVPSGEVARRPSPPPNLIDRPLQGPRPL